MATQNTRKHRHIFFNNEIKLIYFAKIILFGWRKVGGEESNKQTQFSSWRKKKSVAI